MTNAEILKSYIWYIDLYSHSPKDQPMCYEWIKIARCFVGLDCGMIREGVIFENVLQLILYDINVQINRCCWSCAELNFQLFDKITHKKIVLGIFIFDRWYKETVMYYRRGLYDKALSCAIKAETYADVHLFRFKILLLRGEIESSNKNRYEFSVNSLSSALFEAEQLGDIYVAQVYNKLAHMCSMQYASLGMYYLRKAQVILERIGDEIEFIVNKLAMVNSYVVLAMRHQQDEQLFLDEGKRILDTVDYEKLPLFQNKMFYKEMKGRLIHDVEPIIEACTYYEKINAIDDVCRLCDTIIEIAINYNQAAKAIPYIDLYRRMAIKRNKNDLQITLDRIRQAEDIIYEILGKEAM